MASLKTTAIKRIATAAAKDVSSDLEVIGVTLNAGGSDYVEVVLDLAGCRDERCQLVVGVFRNVDEATLAQEISSKVRQHLRAHTA
jgi:hypothetical protein